MNCSDIRDRLALLLYGELAPALEREARAHLEGCDECQTEFARIERAKAALGAWAPIEAPADLAPTLLEPVSPPVSVAPVASGARRAALRPILLGAAAGVVAFALASVVGATVDRTEGSLRIQFGRAEPSSRAGATGASLDATELRQIVATEIDLRMKGSLDAFADLASGWSAAERERVGDAIHAMRIENERQRIHESLRTQEVVDGIVRAAFFEPAPHRP